jgi:hypothetical protein
MFLSLFLHCRDIGQGFWCPSTYVLCAIHTIAGAFRVAVGIKALGKGRFDATRKGHYPLGDRPQFALVKISVWKGLPWHSTKNAQDY